MRDKLIAAGVKKLKEFGYPGATTTNILTNPIYKRFFKLMLEGESGKGIGTEIDALLDELSAGKERA